MTLHQLIDQLDAEGGAIVSSEVCSEIELADARATGRFSVNAEGYGYVRRYKEWLELNKAREKATPPVAPASAVPQEWEVEEWDDDGQRSFDIKNAQGEKVGTGCFRNKLMADAIVEAHNTALASSREREAKAQETIGRLVELKDRLVVDCRANKDEADALRAKLVQAQAALSGKDDKMMTARLINHSRRRR